MPRTSEQRVDRPRVRESTFSASEREERRTVCPSCSAHNRATARFCGECGASLAAACPACGAANDPGQRFCNECGSPLALQTANSTPDAENALHASPTQRRLVSVLFADLVGFTPASEHRDAEETRELLTRYFDSSRKVVERYGGTIEKFIGDAVMAVWGAPVAQEDDAERAVRAALDLVAAVSAFGTEIGAPELQLRAAVLTGEAAVTLAAQGQGMVAGDIVNTASRIQTIAEPGAVLVGESTRRATEAAIAYEHAGEHQLKGKAEFLAVWRALRVTAARRGGGRSSRLEAPFVGRDGEFACSRTSSTRRPTRSVRGWLRCRRRGGSASRDWHGNSRNTSTAWLTRFGGTVVALSPTARESLTGRWPRCCACGLVSARRTSRLRRA